MNANILKSLMTAQHRVCVSIYLPTQRSGGEKENRKDALLLKNILKRVVEVLIAKGLTEKESKDFLDPVYQNIGDPHFWRFQEDALAIFVTKKDARFYSLPYPVSPIHFVDEMFYVVPLIPIMNMEESQYRVLALDLAQVRFFEGDRFSMKMLDLPEHLPLKLEEVVGHDFKEKHQTQRSLKNRATSVITHGQRDARSEKKNELLRYFRAINEAVVKHFKGDTDTPLILACADEHFALYKSINSYQNLCPKNLSGHPSFPLNIEDINHLMDETRNRTREEKVSSYKRLAGTGKTSTHPEEIETSSRLGKVDCLFVAKPSGSQKLEEAVEKQATTDFPVTQADHLTNLSVINTYRSGGRIFEVDSSVMPGGPSPIYALFRY